MVAFNKIHLNLFLSAFLLNTLLSTPIPQSNDVPKADTTNPLPDLSAKASPLPDLSSNANKIPEQPLSANSPSSDQPLPDSNTSVKPKKTKKPKKVKANTGSSLAQSTPGDFNSLPISGQNLSSNSGANLNSNGPVPANDVNWAVKNQALDVYWAVKNQALDVNWAVKDQAKDVFWAVKKN